MSIFKSSLFLALTFLSGTAQTQQSFEEKLEHWLDSTMVSREITWEESRSQFYKYAEIYFNKKTIINDVLVVVIESGNTFGNEFSLAGFEKNKVLRHFASESDALLTDLEDKTNGLLQASSKNNEFSDHVRFLIYLNDFNYYKVTKKPIDLAKEAFMGSSYIKSKTLFEKVIITLFVHCIYNDRNYVDKVTFARNSCDQITIDGRHVILSDSLRISNPLVEKEDTASLDFSEFEPKFVGGETAMMLFIQKRVVYPELAKNSGIEGTVYVQFCIDTTGQVTDIQVLKSPSDILSTEAVRIIMSMPAWIPGIQAGVMKPVKFQIPISL